MEMLHKKTRFIFFSGLIYAFLITITALIFTAIGGSLFPYAAKELIYKASEILSFAVISSAFTEIFIKRFER